MAERTAVVLLSGAAAVAEHPGISPHKLPGIR